MSIGDEVKEKGTRSDNAYPKEPRIIDDVYDPLKYKKIYKGRDESDDVLKEIQVFPREKVENDEKNEDIGHCQEDVVDED